MRPEETSITKPTTPVLSHSEQIQEHLEAMQMEWETEAIANAVERYEQYRTSAEERDDVSTMSAVERLLLTWYRPLVARIQQVSCRSSSSLLFFLAQARAPCSQVFFAILLTRSHNWILLSMNHLHN